MASGGHNMEKTTERSVENDTEPIGFTFEVTEDSDEDEGSDSIEDTSDEGEVVDLSWGELDEEGDTDTTTLGKQDLSSKCEKLKEDPTHHDKYLSLETILKISEGSEVDHLFADVIRMVKPSGWREIADAVVLVCTKKERRREIETDEGGHIQEICRCTFYGTGFVDSGSLGEGILSVSTTCHNVLQYDSDEDLVSPESISVVFFHNGIGKQSVTCKVANIARKSLPIREYGKRNDRRHLDYAALFVNIEEQVTELRSKLNNKSMEPIEKKATERRIGRLVNLKPIVLGDFGLYSLLLDRKEGQTLREGCAINAVCVGHPHGAPLKFAFGQVRFSPKKLGRYISYERNMIRANHTCPTCKGFSGCPVFTLPSNVLSDFADVLNSMKCAQFVHVKHELAISSQSIISDAILKTQIEPDIPSWESTALDLLLDCAKIHQFTIERQFRVTESEWTSITENVSDLRRKYLELKGAECFTYIQKRLPAFVETMELLVLKLDQNEPLIITENGLVEASRTEPLYIYNCISGDEIPQYVLKLQEFLSTDKAPEHTYGIHILYKMLLCALEFHKETLIPIKKYGVPVFIKLLSTCNPLYLCIPLHLLQVILHKYIEDPEGIRTEKLHGVRHDIVEPLLEIMRKVNEPYVVVCALGVLIKTCTDLPSTSLPFHKEDILNPTVANALKHLLHGTVIEYIVLDTIIECLKTLKPSLGVAISLMFATEDTTRLVRLLQQRKANDVPIYLASILRALAIFCTHSPSNKLAVFEAGGIPRIAQLFSQPLLVQNRALALIAILTSENPEQVQTLLEAGIPELLLKALVTSPCPNEPVFQFTVELSWVFGIPSRFFTISVMRDYVIMITLAKILTVSKSLGCAEAVTQKLIEGGVVNKIEVMLKRGDCVSKILAKELASTLSIPE